MADISKITLPSGNTYDIKDAVARQMISGGVSFIIAWNGTGTPDASKIPAGVVAGGVTGTLAADSAEAGAFYLVKSDTQAGSTLDKYDEYVPVGTSGSKTWEKIGDTQLDLSDVVTGVTLNKQTSSAVTGYASPTTDTVIGSNSTFTVTQPTITVTPSTTNIKATASGTAVGANGTAAAITGFGAHTTDTFVKSVSAETNKNLVTTTVPNVTGNTSVSIPNVTGNTSVTANKSTWTFSMGSGDAAETLIIGGGNGSDVTATNTTLGTNLTATNTTLGTAITVATGATSTTGTGDAVVTGVTIGSSAAAITALGTPTTSNCLTGVKVTTQPTIALATGATAGTGVISVATGISSASATGGNVAWNSKDQVTALTGLGTPSTATVLNNSTSISVTKGNE